MWRISTWFASAACKVNLNVALRIDHDRLALRSQHVGGMCQTAQIKLFEAASLSSRQLPNQFYRAHQVRQAFSDITRIAI